MDWHILYLRYNSFIRFESMTTLRNTASQVSRFIIWFVIYYFLFLCFSNRGKRWRVRTMVFPHNRHDILNTRFYHSFAFSGSRRRYEGAGHPRSLLHTTRWGIPTHRSVASSSLYGFNDNFLIFQIWSSAELRHRATQLFFHYTERDEIPK